VKQNIIKEKTFALAVRIVKLYKLLCNDKKEYVLSKQLLRAGTSIGANVQEAQAAQSKKRFCCKDGNCLQGGEGNKVLVAASS